MGQKSFWGRYGIRAIVQAGFGPQEYQQVGLTYADALHGMLGEDKRPEAGYWVAVGHDARLHSPELVEAMITGLREGGLNVVFLGLCTSPMVYFSEHLSEPKSDFPKLEGTVVVTASHNPSEYNGVKFTFQQRTLEEEEFAALKQRYETRYLSRQAIEAVQNTRAMGERISYDVKADYRAWMAQAFGEIGKGLKVVVDSGNATAGIVAPDVLRSLGCEVVERYSEPDGRFPNHHPDPCVYDNLKDLMATVQNTGADFGLAFDGDADRVGVVDEAGVVVPGDFVTLYLTEDVLKEHPGAKVIFDIKSTQTLFDYVRHLGGEPLFSPSGHAYMKRTMRDQDIPLGGELSGHLFFRDRHWGFDDALYAACRVVEAFAHRRAKDSSIKLSAFRQSLPQTQISEEIRVACTPDEGKQLLADLKTRLEAEPSFFGSPVTEILTMDGIRANLANGFFLMRRSGTEPCVTLRFEAPDAASYGFIESKIPEVTRVNTTTSSTR